MTFVDIAPADQTAVDAMWASSRTAATTDRS
jgi:hypothetical protein